MADYSDDDDAGKVWQPVQIMQPLHPDPVNLKPIIEALVMRFISSRYPEELYDLAACMMNLGAGDDRIQIALAHVLELAQGPFERNPEQLIDAADLLGIGDEQAMPILRSLLAQFTDLSADRQAYLAQPIKKLALRTPMGRGEAVRLLEVSLARIDAPSSAADLADAIVDLLDSTLIESYATSIVELLTWPTTTGPATPKLLMALRHYFPDAPGDSDVGAMVDWLTSSPRNLKLPRRPTLPSVDVFKDEWGDTALVLPA